VELRNAEVWRERTGTGKSKCDATWLNAQRDSLSHPLRKTWLSLSSKC